MKPLFIMPILLGFPVVSYGACPGEFQGRAGQVDFVIRTSTDCGDSWGKLFVSKMVKRGDTFESVYFKEFDISDECHIPINGFINTLARDVETISCKSSGKSPLSGMKFRLRKPKNETGCSLLPFVCVEGCKGKSVPRELVFDPQCESD